MRTCERMSFGTIWAHYVNHSLQGTQTRFETKVNVV